jgi:HAD superfamily hydrolase (TIGR01509 family)
MVESVIHDWDGVLNDSMNAVFKTYSIVTGKPIEYIRKVYNPDWRKFEKEANIPKLSDAEWHRIFREQSSDAKLFTGAKEYIKKIKVDGYKTALVTSAGLPRVKNDLRGYNISDVFDAIVAAEDVKELKPNPECLRIAVRRLGSNISECVFIGDTKEDALAAKGIDMKFIGVGWGYHPPEVIRSVDGNVIVNNFDELYRVIKKL